MSTPPAGIRPGAAAAIAVDGLRKSYGDVQALRGIALTVYEGEVFALLGPNGAGKTTAVEILEGYRRRDAGDVTVLGMDPQRGGRRYRERIGIVLQECAIDPYLTVKESLEQRAGYYPAPLGVDAVIELVGLADKRDSRVNTLSGGLQRRLDLGLSLIGDPEVLFLDEPTTGFDPSARRAAWEVIRGLRTLGKTIVLTTHYMDEAQALADRVAVISDGTIIASGTPDTIGDRSASLVEIRFRLPSAADKTGLPLTPTREEENNEVVFETSQPTKDLHVLTSWSLDCGVELLGLAVRRPSLEDVYLQIVGS